MSHDRINGQRRSAAGSFQQPRVAPPGVGPARRVDTDVLTTSPAEYEVRHGDTLHKLARRFGVPYEELLQLNPHLTQGPRRTPGGDLIYVGERIILRQGPSEAEALLDKVKAAQEELALARAEAMAASETAQAARVEAEVAGRAAEEARAQADLDRQASEAALGKLAAEADRAREVAQAKAAIRGLPAPADWQGPDPVRKTLDDATNALARVPADDPERSALAAQVERQRRVFDEGLAKVKDLTEGPKTVRRTEVDETGREVERQVPRELDDETRAIGPEAIALATPAEKAKLIRNLYEGFTSDADQKKILEILAVARGQGQLDQTLGALEAEKTRSLLGFKGSVLTGLPSVMSARNLDRLEQLTRGSTSSEFQDAVDAALESRRERLGY